MLVLGDGGWPVKRHVSTATRWKGESDRGGTLEFLRNVIALRINGSPVDVAVSVGTVAEARAPTHAQTTTIRSFPVSAKSDAFSAGNSTYIITILVSISTVKKRIEESCPLQV